MPLEQDEFSYTAVDNTGKRRKGYIKSSSRGKAYQQLLAKDLTPIEVKAVGENLLSKDIQIPGLEKRAKLKALVIFTKQFALLQKSGIKMLESIGISAEQTDDTVLKPALKAVYNEVESGRPLSEAMSKHPLAFPGLLISVVKIGEDTGELAAAMQSMSKTYQTEMEMKQRIRSAMTYPIIVIVVTLSVLTGMILFVVPMFRDMFENLDADLPGATKVLVAISENAIIIFPIAGVLIVGLVVFFRYFKNELWLKKRVDQLALDAPVFGSLTTKTTVARFCRNLSMMLSSGVQLTESLKLVAKTADNYHIEEATKKAVEQIENGEPFDEAMNHFVMFPRLVKSMLSVGYHAGALPPMLDDVADFFEGEVKEASEKLEKSLEPMLLVVLGGLVGGMLYALYLPMFTLFLKISEG